MRHGGSRKYSRAHTPLSASAINRLPHTEVGPDGFDYHVQYLGPATKTFTCPGCVQTITVGQNHVVAWPLEASFGHEQGVSARRHWHTACWKRGFVAL